MRKSEAKPCPFCGEAPTIEHWQGGRKAKTMVHCEIETCYVGPACTGPVRVSAVWRWNRRSDAMRDPT